MALETLLFDLDDTLYPAESGLWPVLRNRIGLYMHERMGMAEEIIPALRRELFTQYGTTMRGLQRTCGVDTADFLAYVHDVPLNEYLRPDAELREMLLALPQRKLIFTNADEPHAQRVLAARGLEGIFEKIIDVVAIEPHCKPMEEGYRIALRLAQVSDPTTCAMIDDSVHNLEMARKLGLFTVLVSATPDSSAHVSISRLLDLPSALTQYMLLTGGNSRAA